MRVLSNDDVADLLPMAEAIEIVDRTMRRVSSGEAVMPLRHAVPVGGANLMGVMSGSMPEVFGVKLVSLFPQNPARGLSGHRGAVVLFEPETGGAVAMMDAGLLTAIRTAAASGVATRALARADATRLCLIGAGEQAWHHLAAICAARPLSGVEIVARDPQRTDDFVRRATAAHPGLSIRAADGAESAVARADIVCTVTSSPTPVLRGAWLQAGQHLNIVGASVASKREMDDAVVDRARVWVDSRASALAQAGELVDRPEAIVGEIGAVLDGAAPGRSDPSQITAYRSLGVIAQDLACAAHVLARAEAENRGTRVAF